MDADVAVVGLGAMGSMTAWQLARDGLDVLGFERFGIGHDRSAVGGESRIFRTAYKEGPEYVPLLRAAHRLWRALEAESGRRLLTSTGGLTIGAADSPGLRNVLESARRFDLPYEVLDVNAMSWRYPQHRLLSTEVAVLDHTAGVLRPEFAVIAAVRRAAELGARIHDKTTVDSVEPEDDHVVVTAEGRRHIVHHAVLAGGPWTGRLAPSLADRVTVRRIVMTWFAANNPEFYTPRRFPVFTRETGRYRLFGIPTVDGGSVKVAMTSSESHATPDPDRLDRDVRPETLQDISDFVAEYMPGLHCSPHRVSAHMDGYTPDGNPMVGALPGAGNVWLLGGFSGHGFKMAPAIGRAAADLVHNGRTGLPVEHIAPDRPMPRT